MKISLIILLTFILTFIMHPLAAMDNIPSKKLWELFRYHRWSYSNYIDEEFKSNAQTLINAGADINFKPNRFPSDAETPFNVALRNINSDLCEFTLAHGADLAPQDEKQSTLIKLAWAAKKKKSDWEHFHCEPGMPLFIFDEVPIFKTCFVIIKHMVRRHLTTQKTASKTLILCLTRMGRSDYRIGDFTRRSSALLMPYCVFNAKANCREMLLEELTKIDRPQFRGTSIAWDIYPCELLNPERVDDTIERVLRPDKLQAEIDRE